MILGAFYQEPEAETICIFFYYLIHSNQEHTKEVMTWLLPSYFMRLQLLLALSLFLFFCRSLYL